MKKLIIFSLALTLMCLVALSAASCDIFQQEKGTEGLEYYPLPDGTYCVTAGTAKHLEDITIPSKYNGKSVTQILDGAFCNCTSIKSIVIPDSVTSIGNYAFDGCSSLTSITIPDSVTSIGYSAFLGCSNLTSITIPDSVTSIGNYAFESCSSLTSVTIGNGVETIGYKVFFNCSSLTIITIPNSVTSIGEDAFSYCESLTTVYYTGTKSQWKRIIIDSGNSYLTNANIVYNYIP